jgi:hypothetical protein
VHSSSSRSVRTLLHKILVTDSELDAFVIDFFPEIQRSISSQMSRDEKINILFKYKSFREIEYQLHRTYPDRIRLVSKGTEAPPREIFEPNAQSAFHDDSGQPVGLLADFRRSPWLDALHTRRGQGLGLVAGLAVVAVVVRLERTGGQRWDWMLALSGVLFVGAIVAYVRTVLRRKRVQPVSVTRFIGPRSMTAADREARGFFGREAEVERIVDRLAEPHIRHLVLLGESGCGKTSLLRAGVIPALQQRQQGYPIYLRFSDHPVHALRSALREVHAGETRGSLIDDLAAACAHVQKQIILFIDQFEEFHVNPIAAADYLAIQELVWAIVGRSARINAKIVFCLRYDFLHLMDVFYQEQHVDQRFANGEVRIRLEPFQRDIAEEVVCATLSRASDATADWHLDWNMELIRKVLDDLTVQRIIHGQPTQIVLPAELQIVFQMLDAKRIVRLDQYPGKRRLLLDYISDAIDTMPGTDPAQAKQLLLSLIDNNGVTRAKPQTLAQLASVLQQEPAQLRSRLDYLDHQRHLVRTYRCQNATDGTVTYELAHDYLAGVIRLVAGAELSGTRRSEALLYGGRLRAEFDARFRLSLSDCWYLRRYPPAELTDEDRALVRRSRRAFALRSLLPIVVLATAIVAIRFGIVHFAVEHDEIVIKRGIPYLQPLLGSRQTWIATSLSSRNRVFGQESGKAALDQISQEVVFAVYRPFSKDSTVYVDSVLRWVLREPVLSYLAEIERTLEIGELRSNAPADIFITLGVRKEALSAYSRILVRLIQNNREHCNQMSRDWLCDKTADAIDTIAGMLHNLRGSLRNQQPDKEFNQGLDIKPDYKSNSWEQSVWMKALAKLRIEDAEKSRRAAHDSEIADAEMTSNVINNLAIHYDIKELLPPTTQRILADRLINYITKRPARLEPRSPVTALGLLQQGDQRFSAYLLHLLDDADPKKRVSAFEYAIKNGYTDRGILDYIRRTLTSGRERLSAINSMRGPLVIAATSHAEAADPLVDEVLMLASVVVRHKYIKIKDVQIASLTFEFIDRFKKKSCIDYNDFNMKVLITMAVLTGGDAGEILNKTSIDEGATNLLSWDFLEWPSDRYDCDTCRTRTPSSELRVIDPSVCSVPDLPRLARQTNNYDCRWAAIGLLCQRSDVPVEATLEDAECADSSVLALAYAQSVLAPKGGGQTLPELLKLLDSERARRSSSYRAAVGEAIELVARRKLMQAQGGQEISALLQNLNSRLEAEAMPLHLRLALFRLLIQLDRALYRAGRSQRSATVWNAK